jgi:hypothetical protein
VAAATDVLGILPGAKRMATWAAAGLAPLIASYTAVLLTDTAVPVWHEATSTLPAAFVTSAAAAAGGAALVAGAVTGAEPASAAVRLAVGGTIAEAVAARVMHHRLTPVVAAAYRSPAPRAWSAGAAVLGVVGAALTIAARRSRFAVGAAGLMIALGSACERFAVVEAGKASARDPRATTLPQRARALTVGGYPTGTRDADEIHR